MAITVGGPMLYDTDGACAVVTVDTQDPLTMRIAHRETRYQDLDAARRDAYAAGDYHTTVTLFILKDDETYGRRWYGIFRSYR